MKHSSIAQRFQVEFNDDFYVIIDRNDEDGRVVMNGNLYDEAYREIEELNLPPQEWVLLHHAADLEDYVQTGKTVWDRYNQSLPSSVVAVGYRGGNFPKG